MSGLFRTGERRRPRATDGRLTRNVVAGVHKLEHAYTNCYLIEGREGVTVVDTAFPATWPLVLAALNAIDRGPSDVVAVVLTHAHFDHVGFARRAALEWGVPVFVHPLDEQLARHPYRYCHERSRLMYPVAHPGSLRILAAMMSVGALRVKGVGALEFFADGEVLDIPGRPHIVFTPGHTAGQASLFLPDRSAVITGDALVTLNPYTGRGGPQIVSGAATADSDLALSSLDLLAATGAETVLPGHGQPWRTGIVAAVARAKLRGRS